MMSGAALSEQEDRDWASLPRPPSHASLRELLRQLFPDRASLDAWIVDMIDGLGRERSQRIRSLNDRLEMESLLLTLCDPMELLGWLIETKPDMVWACRGLLKRRERRTEVLDSLPASFPSPGAHDMGAVQASHAVPAVVPARQNPKSVSPSGRARLVAFGAKSWGAVGRLRSQRRAMLGAGLVLGGLMGGWLGWDSLSGVFSERPASAARVEMSGHEMPEPQRSVFLRRLTDALQGRMPCIPPEKRASGPRGTYVAFRIDRDDGRVVASSFASNAPSDQIEICLKEALERLNVSDMQLRGSVRVHYPLP